jgi:hypothetical protein
MNASYDWSGTLKRLKNTENVTFFLYIPSSCIYISCCKLCYFRSTTLCVCSAGFTSFYNGLVVFTLLGFMAKTTGIPLHVVASQSGMSLTLPYTCHAFIVLWNKCITASCNCHLKLLKLQTSRWILNWGSHLKTVPNSCIRHSIFLNSMKNTC